MNSRIRVNQSQDFSNTKRQLYENLIDMGFSKMQVDRAFSYSKQKENMDQLLNYLVKGEDGWAHEYMMDLRTQKRLICNDKLEEHQNYQNNQMLVNFSDSNSEDSIENLNIKQSNSRLSSSLVNNNLNLDPHHRSVSHKKSAQLSRIKEEEKENEPRFMYCEVCRDLIPAQDMKELPCKHLFCANCIENYILASMNKGKFFNIKCMTEQCLFVFQDEYIRTLVNHEITEKFFRLKEIASLNADQNVIWCPNPTCNKYMRVEENIRKNLCEINCISCQKAICLKCKRKAHTKKCCFFKKNCEEELNEEYENWAIGKPVQLCPNCSVRTEKTDGCNHMICSVCNYHWCWLCRQQIIYGHYMLSNPFGCPGMSGQEFTTDNTPKWKIYLKRMLILLLICIAFVIGLVIVYPIVFGSYLWLRFYDAQVSSLKTKILDLNNKCIYYFCAGIYIIFGLFFMPICIALAIFPCLPLFFLSSSWRSYIYSSFPSGQAVVFNIQNNIIQRLNG